MALPQSPICTASTPAFSASTGILFDSESAPETESIRFDGGIASPFEVVADVVSARTATDRLGSLLGVWRRVTPRKLFCSHPNPSIPWPLTLSCALAPAVTSMCRGGRLGWRGGWAAYVLRGWCCPSWSWMDALTGGDTGKSTEARRPGFERKMGVPADKSPGEAKVCRHGTDWNCQGSVSRLDWARQFQVTYPVPQSTSMQACHAAQRENPD
eukprot:3926161-Rhodomonas_salina.3